MRIKLKDCESLLAECKLRAQFKYPDHRYFEGLTAKHVQKDLRVHREVYLQLASLQIFDPAYAYTAIRRALVEGSSPDLLIEERRHLWERLADEVVDQPPVLPGWLIAEIETFFGWVERIRGGWISPIPSPDTPETVGPIWVFAVRCYRDETIRKALSLLRRRWRIHPRTNPTNWYRRMNEADERMNKASRSTVVWDEKYEEWHLDAGDPRRRSTYSVGEGWSTVGRPIPDYIADLRKLAWLVGGSPKADHWASWAEGLLWDFKNLPFPRIDREQDSPNHWGDYPRVMPTNHGKILHPPIFRSPVVKSEGGRIEIEFDSRYLRLEGLSGDIEKQVLGFACAIWGGYEEPWRLDNMVEELKTALEPQTLEQVYDVPLSEEIDDWGKHDKQMKDAARRRRFMARNRGASH